MKRAYTQKMGPWSALRVGPYYPNIKAWVDEDNISDDHEGITWYELLKVHGCFREERGNNGNDV